MEGGTSVSLRLQFAMGDAERALNIDWSTIGTDILVGIFQQIWTVLRQRLIFGDQHSETSSQAPVASQESWDQAPIAPAVDRNQRVERSRPLLEPWSCGYRCRWCQSACTRAEGHYRHSCYEHRHRRG